LVDTLDQRLLARKVPIDRRMRDAHPLSELAGLAFETMRGEEADRLVQDRLHALRRPHVAPSRARLARTIQRCHSSPRHAAGDYSAMCWWGKFVTIWLFLLDDLPRACPYFETRWSQIWLGNAPRGVRRLESPSLRLRPSRHGCGGARRLCGSRRGRKLHRRRAEPRTGARPAPAGARAADRHRPYPRPARHRPARGLAAARRAD